MIAQIVVHDVEGFSLPSAPHPSMGDRATA